MFGFCGQESKLAGENRPAKRHQQDNCKRELPVFTVPGLAQGLYSEAAGLLPLGCGSSGQCLLHEIIHVLVMGTLPVDAFADRANAEAVIVPACSWLQPVEDGLFGDRVEQSVAMSATPKRGGCGEQIETPEDLNRLLPWLRSPHKVAVHHLAAFQQPEVASQENTLLVMRGPRQLPVLAIGLVQSIEAEYTQVPGQPSHMSVHHEAVLRQWWTQPRQKAHVQCSKGWVETDPVAISDEPAEIHGGSVDQNKINLGMRHAHRFEHILHGRGKFELATKGHMTAGARQEVVEFAVESKRGVLSSLRQHNIRP